MISEYPLRSTAAEQAKVQFTKMYYNRQQLNHTHANKVYKHYKR